MPCAMVQALDKMNPDDLDFCSAMNIQYTPEWEECVMHSQTSLPTCTNVV
jgi:hypothetical protein